jgi:hypothetical protein
MKAKKRFYLLSCFIILLLFSNSCRESAYTPPVFCGFDELDESNNRVILIGDTQGTSKLEFWREDNKEKTPLLLNKIALYNPACVINLGDLIFCGTSEKQWKRFDSAHKPLVDNKIPYFPLPGNHEYWCSPKKTFREYFARFPHLEERKWYSFRFRNIGFILLDSNLSKLKKVEKENQLTWYKEELLRFHQDPGIEYIIVCLHNPPYTNSEIVKPDKELNRDYIESVLGYRRIAAFFSGHCHSYEKFKVGEKYFIVSGGGGGPRQKLNIDKKTRRFDDLYDGPALRFLNFCQLTIEPDCLCVEVIKLTDEGQFEIADKFIIPKTTPYQ